MPTQKQPGPAPSYYTPNNIKLPAEVVALLTDLGFVSSENPLPVTFTQPTSTPVYETITLSADTAAIFLEDDPTRQGARLLNWLAKPLFIAPVDPPASGPPSDFCPPATTQGGVVWPGQFNFDYAPRGDYYVICEEAGDVTLITW